MTAIGLNPQHPNTADRITAADRAARLGARSSTGARLGRLDPCEPGGVVGSIEGSDDAMLSDLTRPLLRHGFCLLVGMRLRTESACTASLVMFALIVGLALHAPAARAQTMSIGMAGPVRQPAIMRSDLAVFVRVLELDEAEASVLHDLHEAFYRDYMSSQRRVRHEMAELAEEAEALLNADLVRESHTLHSEWRKQAEVMEKAFLDDVAVMLTAEQDARWPIVERELRRLKTMSRGRLIGESVDLYRLVEAEIPAAHIDEAVTEILDRYAAQLDPVLVRRNEFLDEHQAEIRSLVDTDPEGALDLWERATRIRAAVRDTNERFLREIVAELGDDLGARLKDAYERQACSRYTGEPSRIMKMLDRVPDHVAMDASQRERYEALMGEYRERSASLDSRECEARRSWELSMAPDFIAAKLNATEEDPEGLFFSTRFRGIDPSSPVARIRLERLELDRSYRDRVRGLLSEDQWYSVPDTAGEGATFHNLNHGWPTL